MKDQNQIPDGESKQDKWNRGLDIFIESVIKPDPALRQCAHNQLCYHELMDVRQDVLDYLKTKRWMIKPNDPRYFEQSCFKNYDRHDYKVVAKNGDSVVVDDYQTVKFGGIEFFFLTLKSWIKNLRQKGSHDKTLTNLCH